jgi:hypothetical protein
MWETRRAAEKALTQSLHPYSKLLEEAFTSVDTYVDRLERIDEPFARVCALVLVKGRNLALGCFSLSLDALAQEAGALFRPLIESLELLEYLKQDPKRVAEALEERLPKAGKISQRIQGRFKGLRNYLNTHASHLSVTPEAMGHLVDFKAARLRKKQLYSEPVLRRNLRTLLALLVRLCIAAVDCILVAEERADHLLTESVADLNRRTLELIDQRSVGEGLQGSSARRSENAQ